MFGLANFVLAVLAAATLGFAAPLSVHGHDCNRTSVNSTAPVHDHGSGKMIPPLNSTVSSGYANTTGSLDGTQGPCNNVTTPGNTTTSGNAAILANATTPANATSPADALIPSNTPVPGNTTTLENTTNTLGFFDWLFHPLTGTVNFYSRPDCQNPCVESIWCGLADADIRGDLDSSAWSQDQGVACWDRPAGTHSIGLVVGGHGVGDGYAGVTGRGVDWEKAVKSENNGLETRELSWGEGGFVEKQKCNPGGSLPDEMKAVVFVGKGDA